MMDATFIVTENAHFPSLESLVQVHPFLDFVPANASQGVPACNADSTGDSGSVTGCSRISCSTQSTGTYVHELRKWSL